VVLVAALGWVALLWFTGASSGARTARPFAARVSAPRCPSSGGESSAFLFGGGAKLLSETDLSLCVTGRLTVTFAGDRAAGCAARGLCGYAGTETWAPQDVGDLGISTFARRGRRYHTATMVIGGPGSPVLSAVQRTQATGTTTACSDRSQDDFGVFSVPLRGSRVTIGLADADGPLLGTRCAGPLDSDITSALAARTLRLSQVLRGHSTIDLTGSQGFAANGLAGTVHSTIVLVLGRPHRSSGSGRSTLPRGVKRSRLAQVTYRVTHLGGTAIAAVRASPVAAVCGPFDACGLNGVIDVSPGTVPGGSMSLIATAPLSHPKRDLLTALGLARHGNPSGIAVLGGGDASLRGQVAAELTQQGSACRDHVGLRHAAIALDRRAHRFTISLSPSSSQASDPLRTRCPGPELGSHQLTSASLALSVLRNRTFTVAFHGGSFSDGPYRVTTRSTLTITLRRTRVHTQIVPFAPPSG
jgi:hypothetical protein